MNDKIVKPNFTGNTATTAKKYERPEAGAIWEKTSKTSNKKFLTIKLNLPKSKLTELVNKETTETVAISLVAFANEYHQGNDSRPVFRVYEDQQQNKE